MSEGGEGSSLRYGNPWEEPPDARDPLRRLRGHLVLPVTVWLAEALEEGEGPVGLTVSSVLMSQGEPPMLAGLISNESELADALEASSSGRFVVQLLGAAHRRLAQHYSGELPAPANLLAVAETPRGPVLEAVPDRVFCRVSSSKSFGWSLLVEAEVEDIEVGEAGKGLAWYHGGFHVLDG